MSSIIRDAIPEADTAHEHREDSIIQNNIWLLLLGGPSTSRNFFLFKKSPVRHVVTTHTIVVYSDGQVSQMRV